ATSEGAADWKRPRRLRRFRRHRRPSTGFLPAWWGVERQPVGVVHLQGRAGPALYEGHAHGREELSDTSLGQQQRQLAIRMAKDGDSVSPTRAHRSASNRTDLDL